MPAESTDHKTDSQPTGSPPGESRHPHLIGLLSLLLLAACSSQPRIASSPPKSTQVEPTQNSLLVVTAMQQLDRPYRYGGLTPDGFDCSGLVYYVYQRSGIGIPRTARDQLRKARPVPLRKLAPGDLLFFRERSEKASHVGLYVGEGRFIHASTSQQAVTLSRLDNPYWKKQLIGAGRFGY
ncbi:MAG: C40 family peptidase [Candidatus Thiodiazotropha sp.]